MRLALAAAIAAPLIAALAPPARADDVAVVRAFYADVLSAAGSPTMPAKAAEILDPVWRSLGDHSGAAKSRDQFVAQVGGFGKLIPNLKWEAREVIQAGDRITVIGRATGTPAGPFFGVQPAGKSFDILSIDVHRVAGGKIVESWHVEDWAGALRQLRPAQ